MGSIISLILTIFVAVTVVILFYLVSTSVDNTVDDFQHLDQSSCGNITVTDKFTTVGGGLLSVSTNYFVSDNRNTYELIISSNTTEIHQFNQIQVGQTLPIKTFKHYAAFCDAPKLLKGFD